MDLRRFITFKMVVEEGSFLYALQKLCRAQFTITFYIQQPEQGFTIPLFEKIGRRMCLTTVGRNVLPHIYDLTKVMALTRQAARQDSEPGGELHVATGGTLLAYKMSPMLQRSKQRAPKVRLSLQPLNYYSIRDTLFTDEVDLEVLYRVGNDGALATMKLGPQPLALVTSVDQAPVDFLCP